MAKKKISKTEVASTIKRITYLLSKQKFFPTINAGGCGLYAALLAKELENIGENFFVVYIDSSNNAFKNSMEIESNVNNLRGKVSCNHIMIYWNKNYIDAERYSRKLPQKYINRTIWFVELSSDSMLNAYRKSDAWNPTFKRTNLPKISKIIKSEFNKLTI